MKAETRSSSSSKAFSNRNRRPEINRLVTYALSADKQGHLRWRPASSTQDRGEERVRSLIGPALLFVFVTVSALTEKIPLQVLTLYVIVSLVTFFAYAVDKSAARRGGWRTKENTLHLLSLAGGWPGALIAQQQLRHKSKKPTFRLVFWATVALNSAVLAWLFTPGGAATLKSLIAGV